MRFVRKYPLISFVLGVLLPVHGILWPLRLSGVAPELLQGFKILFALLPTSVAFLITIIVEGERGFRKLWVRTFLRQNKLKYYGQAVVSIASLGMLAMIIRYAYDGHWPASYEFPPVMENLLLAPFLLLFPGFTEEFGWRGFMQERLQGKTGVFLASLLTGLVWGSWHGMDFLMGNWPSGAFNVLIFYAYITGTSVLVGGVYTLSGGSIFVAMLTHFSANIVNFYLPVWSLEAEQITSLIFVGLLWLTGLLVLKVKPTPASSQE